MKAIISLLLLFSLWNVREMQAQEIDITGTWTMIEMVWTSGDEVNKTTEDQLKAEGMMSEYYFNSDGTLKIISNMTGSGNMETVEGSWKLADEKLTCTLDMNGNSADIVWGFEFRDEVIHLTRNSPDGSTSVLNSFKRKQVEE